MRIFYWSFYNGNQRTTKANKPDIKQQEIVEVTGKSIATVKRIMKSLQDKHYIRRASGKRYGKGKFWCNFHNIEVAIEDLKEIYW